jgi:hypothetical protein
MLWDCCRSSDKSQSHCETTKFIPCPAGSEVVETTLSSEQSTMSLAGADSALLLMMLRSDAGAKLDVGPRPSPWKWVGEFHTGHAGRCRPYQP